jgi:L-ascorbate metabolism protein UlaG (beta-lactamase superfamily)
LEQISSPFQKETMNIHHFRNATLLIEAGDQFILVDPMLGKPGTISPFSVVRFKARKNPIVPLPERCLPLLEKVTHCLITHKHPDHIDKAAERFLSEKGIPVTCSKLDEKVFKKKGLKVVQTLDYWKPDTFLGGEITGIPARHGYGFIAGPMGNVMGFHVELPNAPSVYISADTIYTPDVERALTELKPDIAVVACGTAQLDMGKPLLMTLDDIVAFIKTAPGKVAANHMEALNHCPTTRIELKERLKQEGLLEKVEIPEDGESVVF